MPDHDAPRALAAAVGPLPTTSANVSGLPEARDAAEILAQLGDAVDLILDGGPAHGGPASTVVDCTGERPVILRAGAIPLDGWQSILRRGAARASTLAAIGAEADRRRRPAPDLGGGPVRGKIPPGAPVAGGAARSGRKESATP